MTKVPMDKDRLNELLEEQKRQRKQRRKRRQLSHINESQLVEPAIEELESSGFCPNEGTTTWYKEPDVFIRERKHNEAPSKVAERPDLICEWKPKSGGESTLYVIELKKRFGKKGLGQIITYYWAVRNGTRIVDKNKEYQITGEEGIIMFIGAIEYKTTYYNQVVEWVQNSLEMDGLSGIEILPLQPD
jgi:hypothetical protein